MDSEKSFDLLVEELRATGESAQKHFRICLVTLALIISSLGFASRNGGEFLSTIGKQKEFYLGIGFLLTSMTISVFTSMNRWSENNWFEFGPPESIGSSEGRSDTTLLRENLERNQINIVISQGLLILSIVLIGASLENLEIVSGLNGLLVGIPLLVGVLYNTFNLDRKIARWSINK